MAGAFTQGWRAYIARWPLLVFASACVLVAAAPTQWFAWLSLTAFGRMTDMTHFVGGGAQQVDPDDAARFMQHAATSCAGTCGNIVTTIVILAPVVAGAALCGATAVAGRADGRALTAGFRRYWATIWVGTLCLFLGGGVSVIAAAVAAIGAYTQAVAALSKAYGVSGALGAGVSFGCSGFIAVCMVWLSARLWLALYRVVDQHRPRMAPIACLTWSWQRTAGAVQWHIVALILVLGLIAGALQIPSEWLATREGAAMPAIAYGAHIVLALGVWLPFSLAASGAVYERLAPAI